MRRVLDHVERALRAAGHALPLATLSSHVTHQMRQEGDALQVEGRHLIAFFSRAKGRFIELSPQVWGLREAEVSRPDEYVSPFCPVPVIFDCLPGGLRLFLLRQQAAVLEPPPVRKHRASVLRRAAAVGAYLLGLTSWSAGSESAAAINPPSGSPDAGRAQLFHSLTVRLGGMDALLRGLADYAPLSAQALREVLPTSRIYSNDLGYRLAFLEMLGVVERREHRYWLTADGLAWTEPWQTPAPTPGGLPPTTGDEGVESPSAPEADTDQLLSLLLGGDV